MWKWHLQNVNHVVQALMCSRYTILARGNTRPLVRTGIILCICPADERRCCNVTLTLIGWVHSHKDPWRGAFISLRPSDIMIDDIIKWKHFPRSWPFVWGINWSPVNSSHKSQWRGALMCSLICAWVNVWVNKTVLSHTPLCARQAPGVWDRFIRAFWWLRNGPVMSQLTDPIKWPNHPLELIGIYVHINTHNKEYLTQRCRRSTNV